MEVVQKWVSGKPNTDHRLGLSIGQAPSTTFPSTPQADDNLRAKLPGESEAFGFLEELRGLL